MRLVHVPFEAENVTTRVKSIIKRKEYRGPVRKRKFRIDSQLS